MKINNVSPTSMVNAYSDNKKKITKNDNIEKSDSLQISSEGRSLSSISNDKNYLNSPEKVERIKNQIAQGTYAPNSKLTAQKMMDIVKGREA